MQWLLGGLGLATAASMLYGYIQTQRLENANERILLHEQREQQLMANVDAAITVNADNLKQLEAFKAEANRLNGIAADVATSNEMLRSQIEALRRNPKYAPSIEQAQALTPDYVCASFDELRKQAGRASPACGN